MANDVRCLWFAKGGHLKGWPFFTEREKILVVSGTIGLKQRYL